MKLISGKTQWIAATCLLATNAAYSQAVNVSPTTLNTVESGLAVSYELVLSQAPSTGETVTVTPSSADVTEGTVSGAVMFTDANWDIPQTITVTPGASGDGNDGDVPYTITNSVFSAGGTTDFAGVLASAVSVTNQNIDGVAVVTVQPSSGSELSIDEGAFVDVTISVAGFAPGAADTFTVPISTVSTEITLSAPSVTLDSGNGFSGSFQITATADAVVDADAPFTVVTGAVTGSAPLVGLNPVDVVGVAVNTDVANVAPMVTAPANVTTEATAALTSVMLGTATVTDDIDVGLVATPDNSGPFPVGMTTVTWSATDSGSLTGTATQTVTITDTTPATIVVTGANPTTLNVGDSYVDAGATASDLVDGDLTAAIMTTNPVDVSMPGTYTVTYAVTDAAGNPASVTRTVVVLAGTPAAIPINSPIALFLLLLVMVAFGAAALQRRTT